MGDNQQRLFGAEPKLSVTEVISEALRRASAGVRSSTLGKFHCKPTNGPQAAQR
jgi:hypothetical protein